MNSKSLDKVLNCPTLPSLPGVAISMLELMRQPSCTADQIAQIIQNDPALTSKVLRTVNSSYYGLSKPCPTITRAVSFLGLNTVKSLTLGLSLVDLGRSMDSGFDLVAYWQRAVYGAAASRILARLSKVCDSDEAFVGALLQDVGMLGCYAALGSGYGAVVSGIADHDRLPAAEVEHFGFDHGEAGARMAEKWRLPDQIIACTRYHHRGGTAPEPNTAIVRIVACAGDAAGTLGPHDPQARLTSFRQRVREWFNIDTDTADEVLQQTGAAAKELSKLLDLDTGTGVDVSAVLSDASDQLLHHQVDMERHQSELARQSLTDPLTRIGNRKAFDAALAGAFDGARATGKPLTVLFVDADKFKTVNDVLGHQAGDLVLTEIARRIVEVIGERGTVFRYGGEEFTIILPGVDRDSGAKAGEQVRLAFDGRPIDISRQKLSSSEVLQTISVGVATDDGAFNSCEMLVRAADAAMYAAKQGGRNRVSVHGDRSLAETKPLGFPGPTLHARNADAPQILVVEDDPLSAKMLEVLLVKHAGLRTVVAHSGDEALKLLRGDDALRPQLVIVDMHMPGMSGLDFVLACRASAALSGLRIAVMSARANPQGQREAMLAGAEAFFDKASLCTDLAGAVRRITDLARGVAKAA